MTSRTAKIPRASWARRLLAAAFGALLLGAPAAGADGDAEITVPISTVRSGKGTVFVALYERSNWLEPGRYVMARKVPAQKGTVHATFRGISRGRYGVAVWHDENANNRVDTNLLGLPTEGYGFSRTTPRRKPSFEEASITAAPRAHAPIKLRY